MRRNKAGFAELFERYSGRIRQLAQLGLGSDPSLTVAARVVLLLGEGRSSKEVAGMCGLSRTRVETLRRRFMMLGCVGLQLATPVPKHSLPMPGAGSARTTSGPAVTVTLTSVRRPVPVTNSPTADTMQGDILAELDKHLRRPLLTPHQRLRLLALKMAADQRLTFTSVAKDSGVALSTLTRWWKLARQSGVAAVLEIPAPLHIKRKRSRALNMLREKHEPTRTGLRMLPGMTHPWKNLLNAAGVGGIAQLADQSPAKLHRWLEEVNCEECIASTVPTIRQLDAWVRLAIRMTG